MNKNAPMIHWQNVNNALIRLVQSRHQDEQAADDAARGLEKWLNDYPGQAADIQRISLSSCFFSSANYQPAAADQFSRVGLDAAFLQPLVSEDQKVSTALLALLGAEAQLGLGDPYNGQRRLDYAHSILQTLDVQVPLHAYLFLQESTLRGTFAESALELEIAAEAFYEGIQAGRILLDDSNRYQELAQRWGAIVFGKVDQYIVDSNNQMLALLKNNIKDIYYRAVLGFARTVEKNAADASRHVVETIARFGLPQHSSPFEFRRILAALPLSHLDAIAEVLIKSAEHLDDADLTRAWRLMVRTTQMVRWAREPGRDFQPITDLAFKEARLCKDALTLAVWMGDVVTARASSLRYPEDRDLIENFMSVYHEAAQAVHDSPLHLPFRAHFDAPIATAVRWAFNAYADYPSSELGGILSVLLDSLRSSKNEFPARDPRPGSVDEGFLYALDQVGRLAYATQSKPDTVAIILQSVADEMLFLCATGEKANPLLFEQAGTDYGRAARELAQALSEEVYGPTPDGQAKLVALGKDVFDALPQRLRELISRKKILLVTPDFRSDQDNVPFELFHDGNGFLGITKVIARFLSLRELVLAIEPSAIRLPHPKQAICVSVPKVEGFKELVYAPWEVDEICSTLEANGWETPKIGEGMLNQHLLLDAGELARIVHIAAHGEVYAGGEALVLPDGERLMVRDIEHKLQSIHAFIFLNTCSLGRSRYLGGGVSRGIAYALVRAGAPCIIANLLPVYDRSASLLSIEFFDQVKNLPSTNTTVGQMLSEARDHMHKQGIAPTHWGTCVLIGNPFYRLADGLTGETGGDEDSAVSLLNAYTSFDATERDRENAWLRAREVLDRDYDHKRLTAAFIWVHKASLLHPDQMNDVEDWDQIARLAHEIGHPVGVGLIRWMIAREKGGKNPLKKLEDLDQAIAALEPLATIDNIWRRELMDVMADRQRLSVPKEPPPLVDGPLRVNDQSDPATRAVFDIQHMIDLDEVRHHDKVASRFPERSLEDLAWNAVVLGQQDRFRDMNAYVEFGKLLTEKLVALGLVAQDGKAHMLRISAGFLPFLWTTQRISHLEWERASGQAKAFFLALKSNIDVWRPPASSPAFPLVAQVEKHLESLISSFQQQGMSKYARALLMLQQDEQMDDFETLMALITTKLKACEVISHQCLADGAAWVLGLILEKHYTIQSMDASGSPILSDLEQLYYALMEQSEAWFMYYLSKGFAEASTPSWELLFHQWRARSISNK